MLARLSGGKRTGSLDSPNVSLTCAFARSSFLQIVGNSAVELRRDMVHWFLVASFCVRGTDPKSKPSAGSMLRTMYLVLSLQGEPTVQRSERARWTNPVVRRSGKKRRGTEWHREL